MVVTCEWHVLSHYREGPSLRSGRQSFHDALRILVVVT